MINDNLSFGCMVRTATRLTAVAVVSVGLTGCGLSSLTSGLGSSVFGGSSSGSTATNADSVDEAQLLKLAKADAASGATGAIANAGASTAISHGCPKVIVRTRDNHMNVYEEGRVGDSLAVRHRGEITKTARECVVDQGRVTVRYGFSGRILLGPRGSSGNVTLPVSVSVTDSSRAPIASDQLQISTDITVEKPIGYFSAVRTVTFDVPQGARPGDFSVYLAFPQAVPGTG